MRIDSVLQAGFQQKSLLYKVEPKGPDREYESINDVDVGHLYNQHIKLHKKQTNNKCSISILNVKSINRSYSRISVAEFGW